MTNLFEVACERIERDMKKPDMVESIADCLVQDHISLMNENESLRRQLTDSQKREVMLRDALEHYAIGGSNYSKMAAEALAATEPKP